METRQLMILLFYSDVMFVFFTADVFQEVQNFRKI